MTPGRQIRFWLLGFAAFLIAVYLLRGILLPFVAGMAVAYFLDPTCDKLERMGLSRTLATTVVTVTFALILIVALVLLVPLLQTQLVDLVERLPVYLRSLGASLQPLLQELARRLPVESLGQAREALTGQAGSVLGWIGGALGGLVSGGLALVNILSLIFITPVVTFYLLRDWDRIVERVDSWLPRGHAAVIREQVGLIDRTLAGWVRGQATVCLLLAAYYGIALSIAGLEFGLAVGLLAGLLSFIPFVGTISGFIAGLGIAFAQYTDWGPIAIVLAIFIVGQVIEGNILTPKLVGGRVGLHPVWVIFGLLAGGALFGFVGVLLALPVAAVIGVLARFSLARYLESRYYRFGETPAPSADAPLPPPRAADSDGPSVE